MHISRKQNWVGGYHRKIKLYKEKGEKDVGWEYGKEVQILQKSFLVT